MAKDYAIRPGTILKRLRRIAPDVEVEVLWSPDYTFRWYGEGPDPAEQGYVAHDVELKVTVTNEDGETIGVGAAYLGGTYIRPDEPDPDISGYFIGMLWEALEEAAKDVSDQPLKKGRKDWDPRRTKDIYLEQLEDAIRFVKRSSEEQYRRNMEYHRRREARERRRQ